MTKQAERPALFGFVAIWMVATLAAYFVGAYASILLRQLVVLGTIDTVPPASIMYLALTPPGFWGPGIIIGLASVSALIEFGFIGFAQWMVLRRRLDISPWWILLTGISAAIVSPPFALWRSHALSTESATFQNSTLGISDAWWFLLLSAATIPLAVSATQWLLLRRKLGGAGWWIPASVTAGLTAFIARTLANLPYTEWRHAILMSPLTSVIGVPAATRIAYTILGFASMIVLQLILGSVLAFLLHRRTDLEVTGNVALSTPTMDGSFA